MERELHLAIEAAQAAGKAAFAMRQDPGQIWKKEDNTFVSEADMAATKAALEILSDSSYPILSEEEVAPQELVAAKDKWVVDPLDGTHGFVDGSPLFCSSVGLVKEGLPFIGVVYAPVTDTLYHAVKGKGAFKTEHGETTQLLPQHPKRVFTLWDPHAALLSEQIEQHSGLEHIQYDCKSLILKLMRIAEGTMHTHISTKKSIPIWDSCAAQCIIEQAGGVMTPLSGEPMQYSSSITNGRGMLTTFPKMQETLLEITRFIE